MLDLKHGACADGVLDYQAVSHVPFHLLSVGREIGAGSFARVYKAKYGDLGSIALKCLKPQHATGSQVDTFFREAALLSRTKHSNIVKCYGICQIPRHAAGKLVGLSWAKETHTWGMVLEYCEGGSLLRLISKQMADPRLKQYNFADAVGWALDVSRALSHMHQQAPMVIHRDIKQENVLLTQDGGGRLVAKLADFGLHKAVDRNRTAFLRSRSHRSNADSSDTATLRSTPPLSSIYSAGQHTIDTRSTEQLFIAVPEDLQQPFAELGRLSSSHYRPSMSLPRSRPSRPSSFELSAPAVDERRSCPTHQSPNLWASTSANHSASMSANRVLDIVRLGTTRMQRCSTLLGHAASQQPSVGGTLWGTPAAAAAALANEASSSSSKSIALSHNRSLVSDSSGISTRSSLPHNRSLASESSGVSTRSSLLLLPHHNRSIASEGSGVSSKSLALTHHRSLYGDGNSSGSRSSPHLRSFTGGADGETVGVFSQAASHHDHHGLISSTSEHFGGTGSSSSRHQRSPLYISTPAFIPEDHDDRPLGSPVNHQPPRHAPLSPRSPIAISQPASSSPASRLTTHHSLPAQPLLRPIVLSPHSVGNLSNEDAPWLSGVWPPEFEQSGVNGGGSGGLLCSASAAAGDAHHYDGGELIDPTAFVARAKAAKAANRASACQYHSPGIPEESGDASSELPISSGVYGSGSCFIGVPELDRASSTGFARTSTAHDLGPRRLEFAEGLPRPLAHRRASFGVLVGGDELQPQAVALLLPSLSYDLRLSPAWAARTKGSAETPPVRRMYDLTVARTGSDRLRTPLKANSEGRIEPYGSSGVGVDVGSTTSLFSAASLQFVRGIAGGSSTGGGTAQHDDEIEEAAAGPVQVDELRDMLSSAGLQFDRDWQHVFSLTGETGSLIYMAPEVYSKLPYNEKVDVFSFGVLLYEMFTCTLLECTHINTTVGVSARPFRTLDDFAAAVVGGFRPARTSMLVDEHVWHLIQDCWSDDPCQRPNMEAVIAELEALHSAAPPCAKSKKRIKGSVTLRHWLSLIMGR